MTKNYKSPKKTFWYWFSLQWDREKLIMYCFSTITLCELKLWSVLFFFFFSTYTTPSLSIVDYFIKTFSFTMKFFSKTFFSASAASHFKYYLKPEKNNSFIFSYSKKGFTLHYLYITLCRKFSNKNICFLRKALNSCF